MEYTATTLRSFLLLIVVSSVLTVCPDPIPCNRDGDTCEAIQKYVDCLVFHGRDCPEGVKKRHDVAIKIMTDTYSLEPFNCQITSGSSALHIGYGLSLVVAAVLFKN